MNAEIAAALRDIFRVGEVVETDPKTCTAVVTFPDTDDVISAPLIVAQRKTHKDKNYWMPDVGELVGCIFLGNGPIAGFVMFAVYNQIDTPPIADNDKHYTQYEDGTLFEYDRKKHELTNNIKGNVHITVDGNEGGEESEAADGTVNIKVKDAITIGGKNFKITLEEGGEIEANEIKITSDSDVTLKASGNLDIETSGNAAIKSSGNFNIAASGKMDIKSSGDCVLEATGTLDIGSTAMTTLKGQVTMNQAATPTGSGPFCGLPACLFTGAPHSGNLAAG